jgi:hypothetical protein
MKMTNAIVAVLTALALGGCYWSAPAEDAGGISLTVGLGRGVLSPETWNGDLLRAWLYDAGAVAGDITGDYQTVAFAGAPIPVDGYDYYDVPLLQLESGSFVVPDIAPGRRYRLYLMAGYNSDTEFVFDYHGLSGPFEVSAGGTTDIGITLYYYYFFC